MIDKKVNINVKVLEKWQRIILNVLKKMKYCIILKMSWLRNQNLVINWMIRKLCVNKIKDQIKELLKYESWDHKMSLLLKRQSM